MKKNNILLSVRKSSSIAQALMIAAASLLPAMLLSGQASAGQLQNRYVDLSSYRTSGGSNASGSGEAGGTGVTYTVGFDVPVTGVVEAIAVQFCGDPDGVGASPTTGPILLDACDTPQGFDVDAGALAQQNGISGFTVNALTDTNLFVISNAAGGSITSDPADTVALDGVNHPDSDVKFDITGVTNPSDLGTFYARITTYADTTDLPATWDPEQTGVVTGIGNVLDDGGVAMAIANELTITARVQEVLQFCVGSTYSGTSVSGDDCSDVTGTAINMGVVDSASTTETVAGTDGKAMIRTNANSGAVIYYKAEQDTSSGKLKVAGATCNAVVTTDQCFNSVGTTKAAITSGTEAFGMSLTGLTTANGVVATTLTCHAQYNGDGTACTGAPTGYAWDDSGSFDTIASSTSVLDDVLVNLRFAATASPTTPTGLYTVTANFVATATF